MKTDKAGRENIDVYDLFAFSNPMQLPGEAGADCEHPFEGECPVYDITQGLPYAKWWSEDGARYTVQLLCPAPDGTPSASLGNYYKGGDFYRYLAGNSTGPEGTPYSLHVAPLRLGVTRARLKAAVSSSAATLRQAVLTGEFGTLEEPRIVRYVASNYDNADFAVRLSFRVPSPCLHPLPPSHPLSSPLFCSLFPLLQYGATDRLTIVFDKPTDKGSGTRYGLKTFVDALFLFSEGTPADDYSGEWTDDSTFQIVLIDPTDIIPSVADAVPFSTRPSDLRVTTAGGDGLPGALIQNRAASADRIASSAVEVKVSGSFGQVRTPQLVSFTARDVRSRIERRTFTSHSLARACPEL